MIIGLTDSINFRRDGKIRSGTRDDASGKMDNFPYFLLHDAPQLIPVLGEHPTEVYFTVPTDRVNLFFRPSLRWYTKNELMCVSTHEIGRPIAAYHAFGDAPGVKQNPHPVRPKARERSCMYKSCQQYQEGKCFEHFFLDMIIPQYSLGSVFTLDNTSINAVLNVDSAIKKGLLATGGKLTGQVFRLYKKTIEVDYTDLAKSKKYKREMPVIHMDFVPWNYVPESIKGSISTDNMAALDGLKSGSFKLTFTLPAPDQDPQLEDMGAHPIGLPSPEEQTTEAEAMNVRANDPLVIQYLDELSALTGATNSEENRIKLAKFVTPPTVEGIITYVKSRIQKEKHNKEQAST